MDKIGRKRIAICGFAMLGIDAATLGLFPTQPLGIYFSAALDGVSWGFLWVIFIVTIWGDLAQSENSSKYYAIGVLPFFVSKFLELAVGHSMSTFILNSAGENGLFSFLAFFLFIAVLPLVYAPETLPEKVMKDRDLKSYVDKAMKKVKTEVEKEEKVDNKTTENEGFEFQVEQPEEVEEECKEAERLAEKYY